MSSAGNAASADPETMPDDVREDIADALASIEDDLERIAHSDTPSAKNARKGLRWLKRYREVCE